MNELIRERISDYEMLSPDEYIEKYNVDCSKLVEQLKKEHPQKQTL